MYFYKIYGVNVGTYRKINELVEYNHKDESLDINIYIYNDRIPIKKKALIEEKKWFSYSKDSFIFRIVDNATYLIEDGKSITIEEVDNANSEDIKTFLLGTSFGMLLKQRNIVAIHGGSILIGDKVTIFTGDSGAGKSTITNAFRLKGFKFLADDVSATDCLEDGTIIVNPAYPQQKICRDAMEKMGYSTDDFKLIDEGRGKYVIPARESFCYDAMPLGSICEIAIGDCEDAMVEEIKGADKINLIVKNIYRGEIFLRNGIEPEYFKKIVNIAKNVSAYRIIRPRDKFSVNEQIEAILDKLGYEHKVLM